MAHVTWSDMAKGLRIEGFILQKLSPFRNNTILKAAGIGSVWFFKAMPTKLLGGENIKIPMPNGKKLKAAIYKGKGYEKNEGPRFAIMWLHGGGYIMGGPNMINMTIARKILNRFNCVMLVPDYSLSWQAPHPAALHDCWAALQWLKENAKALGATTDKLVIGGESSGAGSAVSLALYARDHGFDDIALQVPLYPMLDPLPTETNVDNDAPNWNSVANDLAWRLYLGEEPTEHTDKYGAPARETDWSNLPATVTFVGTIEPFYAEVKTFAENLRRDGTPVAFKEFKGGFHAFDMMQPFAKISKEATKWALDSIGEFLKTL